MDALLRTTEVALEEEREAHAAAVAAGSAAPWHSAVGMMIEGPAPRRAAPTRRARPSAPAAHVGVARLRGQESRGAGPEAQLVHGYHGGAHGHGALGDPRPRHGGGLPGARRGAAAVSPRPPAPSGRP